MAVVFIFRLAIAVTPTVVRLCKTNGCDANAWGNAAARFYGDLIDPEKDPDELSAEMSASLGAEGGSIVVTDFTGTFELRKLQWRLSRAPSGGTVEDQDVCTFHFIKVSSGSPTSWATDGTDLAAVETALGTYWGAIKGLYPPWTHSDQYRWYRDGPAYYQLNDAGTAYIPLTSGNAAVRVTEVDVAGTGSSTTNLPPQCALTVTERTSTRHHWGRWYLPATNDGLTDTAGRLSSGTLSTILTASVAFYNSCRSSSVIPVVWSIQKPERQNSKGETLAAWPATAFEVTSLQMDNLYDVVRRRRWDAATIKTNTALT